MVSILVIAAWWFCTCIVTCVGEFDPYVDNGGTVVAIAGKDYCIIAADTRLSEGYIIRSRNTTRIFQVCFLGYRIYSFKDCFQLESSTFIVFR